MKTASKLPTVEQLAALAAALARTGDERPDTLAKRALALWRASGVALWSESRERRRVERSWAKQLPRVDFPKDKADVAISKICRPEEFPIEADCFARLTVPTLKGRTGDAADAIKGWLWWLERWRLEQQGGPMRGGEDRHAPEVKPKVDRLFAAWNKRQLSETEFWNWAPNFALWYAQKHADKVHGSRSESGRKGGLASGKTRKRQALKEGAQEQTLLTHNAS